MQLNCWRGTEALQRVRDLEGKSNREHSLPLLAPRLADISHNMFTDLGLGLLVLFWPGLGYEDQTWTGVLILQWPLTTIRRRILNIASDSLLTCSENASSFLDRAPAL
jgi:hypothetical protein